MKKLILSVTIVSLFSIVANAQTEKGRKFVGGSLNFNAQSYNYTDTSSNLKNSYIGFRILPTFGYFVSDNLAIGINLNLGYTKTNDNITSSSYDYYILGSGLFIRKFYKITDSFMFFVQGNTNYAYSTNTFLTINRADGHNISLSIIPGFIYFVNKNIGIEGTFGNLSYQYSINSRGIYNSTNSTFGLNLNNSTLNIGLNYYF